MTIGLILVATALQPAPGGPGWTAAERACLDARAPVRDCADPGYPPLS
jgi:hypothetical protein